MHTTNRIVFLLAGCLLGAGCGPSVPLPPTLITVGPHKGMTFRLPQDQGYVEVVNEPEPKNDRDTSPTALVAYYLQTDAKTPLAPVPSAVSAKLNQDRGSTTVPLGADPKSGDPAGAARFASKPGPYNLGTVRGVLVTTVSGQPVEIDFSSRR